jgi:phosphate uptake regulator
MRRKVVLQGGFALTVALPINWAKKNNILKGHDVEITEQHNKLEIHPITNYETEKVKSTITISYKSQLFSEQIEYVYRKGYDKIKINFKKITDFKFIEKSIKDLMGFTIINQTENECVVKNTLQLSDKDFKNILRRNFLVCISLSSLTLNFLENKDKKILDEVLFLQKLNKRLSLFCRRFLLKNPTYTNAIELFSLIKDLEQLTGDCVFVLDEISNSNLNEKKVIPAIEETNKLLTIFYQQFYKQGQEEDLFSDAKENINRLGLNILRRTIIQA